MTAVNEKKLIHRWNIICVKKFTYPMPRPVEFSVESKTLHGASMKACKKLKDMDDGWSIKSIYWLDPKYSKRGF